MKLQTNIPLQKGSPEIDYNSRLLVLGSCFAENIGNKLEYYKFQHLKNPFGILFQPKAIEKMVDKAVNSTRFKEEDIFFHNERWHSFDVHSTLSNADKSLLLSDVNNGLLHTQNQLREATHIILTLGTAWAYRHLKKDRLVANCHRVPQKEFAKELLTVNEIIDSLDNLLNAITSINPEAIVLLTISPVRHLKDGFLENQRSKAHLIAAVHQILKDEAVFYFPAYEIMMDELRDYRFYKEDMVHPNQLAINYIWEHFTKCWMSSDAIGMMAKVEEVQKGLQHIPFNPDTEQHRRFENLLQQKIVDLQNAYPHMKF
ncbi:GSCFA domain-containing protein [Muriicola sp. Z0-33]|uniref:GSCFA domain-containing protein n=1 Tax=Muriicola sp. Z0-33 TaxID=2816957 RepID=UPI002237308F|nr:GSCFA domain-containing protein [Muriicola sp. Z0-33]MCW5517923.1 GSCFA domain-containing protein [Muriicola sp. Z0-33]